MEKPDLKVLGLGMAEELVEGVIKKIVKPYAAYYIQESENKIDDILLPFLDQLEAALLEFADKIDGEEG